MAARFPPRLSAAEGRRFGFTVGAAFAVLALVVLWRADVIWAGIMLGIAGALVASALSAPTRLGPVERAWMAFAHHLSKLTTPVFMAIVYFLVLTPTALVRRLGGGQRMISRPRSTSRWAPHVPTDPARMERQF